ncbi:MAG: hypothetical protein U5K75_01755 [Ahrensia sp.]|nr:hypothetical protein [Ahrensia sp.]
MSAGFAVSGCLGISASLRDSKKIILGDSQISAPKSLASKKIVTIAYGEITELVEKDVSGQAFLTIKTTDQKLDIACSGMASKEKFSEMYEALVERIARQNGQ